MGEVDRQRISAVKTLEAMGYRYRDSAWHPPAVAALAQTWKEADALHSLLVSRADAIFGCTDGSVDEDELGTIGEAIEAYEQRRWPQGKVDGGKG